MKQYSPLPRPNFQATCPVAARTERHDVRGSEGVGGAVQPAPKWVVRINCSSRLRWRWRLPGRLHADQVAKLLNCTVDDIAVLSSAGNLRPLGKPRPNAVKFFSTIELITQLADREWLDDVTKTPSQHWRRKNERRITSTPKRRTGLLTPPLVTNE
jgi:hypothetical protein